jgi:alpha-mannosidase II
MLAAALLLLSLPIISSSEPAKPLDPNARLTIHLIPHSHCDPGWLDSFERYYETQVASILSSVTRELEADPARRFVWAEISFFMRWYEAQSDSIKDKLAGFVRSGQFEFVGGGWVQNDEANPSYESIISQISEGNEYLLSLSVSNHISPYSLTHSVTLQACQP